MSGPVIIPFKSFIRLQPKDATALYLQIVFEFIKAIQMGHLPQGTKLPGTRQLCSVLGINRNTLIKAFQDLEAQGWIEILPNRGTFILSEQKHKKADAPPSVQNKSTGFSFKQSTILENPVEASTLPYQFNDGLPDVRLVQTNILARLYVSKLKTQKTRQTWQQAKVESRNNFRAHFANYLNLTRGIRIGAANLLTTGSHEISLYLAIKLLIAPGDAVVVAAPGYFMTNMTLADSGAKIIALPVDDEGIITQHLEQMCQKQAIRMLYLTSSYHYPTNTLLSAKRRIEVLELARKYGFVILEDDYDFDFHYDNNPVLPLKALESNIVYVGSFGRSLPVGFGYGFVAAPEAFIAELEKHQSLLEPEVDVLKEQALTQWLQDGEVHRLSKKNKKLYKERRDYFATLLNEKLKGRVQFDVPARGLAFWVVWKDRFNLVQFQKECAALGLFLPKTILYQTKDTTATRLGFGHLDNHEADVVAEILVKALEKVTDTKILDKS